MNESEPEHKWIPSRQDVVDRLIERLVSEVDESKFSGRLKLLRMALGMSVQQVADLCLVDDGSWSNWENGSLPRAMNKVVEQIAASAACDAQWLMWGDEIPCFTHQAQLWPVAVKDAS